MDIKTILLLITIALLIYYITNTNVVTENFKCGTRPSVLDEWKKMIPFYNRPMTNDYYKLINTPIITSYGTPNPLKPSQMLLENDKNIVSVDGTKNAPRSLAVFSFNRSSPECCQFGNGGYSTDRGCVCITPNQEQWFTNVGNNRYKGYDGF